MLKLNRIKDYVNRPVKQALSRFMDFWEPDGGELSARDKALVALLKWSIMRDGKISEREFSAFRDLLKERTGGGGDGDISALLNYFRDCEPLAPSESVDFFAETSYDERVAAVGGLIRLGLADGGYTDLRRGEISAFAEALDLPADEVAGLENSLFTEYERRRKLLRSGTGLLAALIVIAVFVLTATWLRSVIFGLILAYIFLPLEKFIERRMLRSSPYRGGAKNRSRGKNFAGKMVGKIKRFVGSDGGNDEMTAETPEAKHRSGLVTRACTCTVGFAAMLLTLLSILLFAWGVSYVSGIGNSVRDWAESPPEQAAVPAEFPDDSAVDAPAVNSEAAPAKEQTAATQYDNAIYKISVKLDRMKADFQNIPAVSWGIGEISRTLNNPEAQQRFFGALLQRSGGIIQFSLRTLSSFASVLVDILLTVFFFSFFLRTVALNTDEHGRGQSLGTYCVRTVFNGHWLPAAGEDTMKEAENIIGTVFFKLKTWLKGYIILISIDFIVYSTVFALLGVPYALILGFIAGCGLLLPYIGPILSALLTILVTLALGGNSVSGLQIAGIIGIYLVENGIVEQFFLYPAVIGEALGLTTLETIIVVLLGGIFAGITGMIFALPAAAVIKYLVPQIYRSMRK
ncbi:MAG: AI-2E family transporter [Victivallaceae bacterium]|nr:AI-2E family transporter [Victivallaceae bacterium]